MAHFLHTEGIGEQGGQTLIYPNPVNDKLTIEAQEAIDNIEIYNVMGALIYSRKDCGDKAEINTTDLPAGTYVVRLTTKDTTTIRRLVKE